MTEVVASDRVVSSTHNNPPEPTPIEAAKETISLLDVEVAY